MNIKPDNAGTRLAGKGGGQVSKNARDSNKNKIDKELSTECDETSFESTKVLTQNVQQ